MVLIFDNHVSGVLDFSFSSYVTIFFVSGLISFLTTALTSRDGPFGSGPFASSQEGFVQLNGTRTRELLRSAVVEEAYSKSSKSYLRSRAQEDTLYTSLKSLRNAQKDDWSILWINGHIEERTQDRASDLMQILARRLAVDNDLAATFSCTNPQWKPEQHLIPTLAYQLAQIRPGTGPHIDAAIATDPSLFNQVPRVQFDRLITTPLIKDYLLGTFISAIPQSGQTRSSSPPSYFILDAFHNCGSDAFQSEILHAISRLIATYEGPPLTFIIGSKVTETLSINLFTHRHLSQRTKPLIIDSSTDDSTILAGASINPTPLLLRQAYSPIGKDHFYTVDNDEFVRAQQIAYQPLNPTHNPYRLNLHNAIGGAYSTLVPYTVPLFRLFNIGTGDHHYTTDMKEVRDAGKVGYALECVAGFVFDKHGEPGKVNVSMGVGVGDVVVKYQGGDAMKKPWGLWRMWNGVKRDHAYISEDMDRSDKERLVKEGYIDEGVVARLVPLF